MASCDSRRYAVNFVQCCERFSSLFHHSDSSNYNYPNFEQLVEIHRIDSQQKQLTPILNRFRSGRIKRHPTSRTNKKQHYNYILSNASPQEGVRYEALSCSFKPAAPTVSAIPFRRIVPSRSLQREPDALCFRNARAWTIIKPPP